MDYKIIIPSYKRADKQYTLEYLHALGVPRERIYLATQTETDRDLYTERYGHIANILYRPANNVAGNRNTALQALDIDDVALCLDDDVKKLQAYTQPQPGHKVGSAREIDTLEKLDAMVEKNVRLMLKNRAKFCGLKITANQMFWDGEAARGAIVNRLSTGGSHILIYTGLRYDENYRTKEDYYYQLELKRRGWNFIFNPEYRPLVNYSKVGGCHEAHTIYEDESTERIFEQFPGMLRRKGTDDVQTVREMQRKAVT